MAELADAHGSGPCEQFHAGSSPVTCTSKGGFLTTFYFFSTLLKVTFLPIPMRFLVILR